MKLVTRWEDGHSLSSLTELLRRCRSLMRHTPTREITSRNQCTSTHKHTSRISEAPLESLRAHEGVPKPDARLRSSDLDKCLRTQYTSRPMSQDPFCVEPTTTSTRPGTVISEYCPRIPRIAAWSYTPGVAKHSQRRGRLRALLATKYRSPRVWLTIVLLLVSSRPDLCESCCLIVL